MASRTRGAALIVCGCSSKGYPLLVRTDGVYEQQYYLGNTYKWEGATQVAYSEERRRLRGTCKGCRRSFAICILRDLPHFDKTIIDIYEGQTLADALRCEPDAFQVEPRPNRYPNIRIVENVPAPPPPPSDPPGDQSYNATWNAEECFDEET